MAEVCWTCYQLYRTADFSQLLWTNGCIQFYAHQWRHGGMENNSVVVTYHEESGLLLRPFPEDAHFYGKFQLCRNNPCSRPQCTYAHNDLELTEWNREKQARSNHHRRPPPAPCQLNLGRASLTKIKHRHNYELPPESELDEDLLTQPLTRKNYVDKFHTLLYYEEHEHVRVLKERCDKELEVRLHDENNERFGSLIGLSSNDVAYLQQNATHAEIGAYDTVIKVAGEIFNRSSGELDQVYVKLDDVDYLLLNDLIESDHHCFAVHFRLKHSYFQNLHRSLNRLSLKMIERLVPCHPNFQQKKLPKIPKPRSHRLHLDWEYQQSALKKMIVSDSTIPFLVTGPFGTGKTRLLAAAAFYFIKNHKNRVLICTSHLQSADEYIDSYFGQIPSVSSNVVRLTGKDYIGYSGKYKYLFTDGFDLDGKIKIRSCRLVVTTFLTAPQLIRMKVKPFTHILIDEGAQTREPEAIAPLGLADDNTKIVIAGDHLQIGPQVLVKGKKVCESELGTSLLQRLHSTPNLSNSCRALLLINYRCHGSIVRLPSYLFYKSTLQVESRAYLHPKMYSALAFVCTSIDSATTTSKTDCSQEEAKILLKQVQDYINPWPAEWGRKRLFTVCVMASSRNQVRILRKLLNHSDFQAIKGIKTSTTYELQGREFRAIFISTVEKTEDDGSTSDPTKSICDQYVFNTVITRAQSLVVCVGDPFLLLSIEKSTPGYSISCWREYIKRCLETLSLQLSPHCYEAGESVVQDNIRKLYREIFGDLHMSLDHFSPGSLVSDSILKTYYKAYLKAIQSQKVPTENSDRDNLLQEDEAPDYDAQMEGSLIECTLKCDTYRDCIAVPLNPNEPDITINGINNRRGALEGAQVKVRVYKDSDRCGCVREVVKQGPQRQFVCRVDSRNASLYPIDHKSPKLSNLPGLSQEILQRVCDHETIEERAITVFDSSYFHKDKHNEMLCSPQVKDVIPLHIAKNMLFVMLYLKWTLKYRYPLGVVIAAMPKGLTLYHGERLLLAHHHINTAPVDKIDDNEELTIADPELHYDHAFTIDPSEAKALDDALTLEPVASDDGKCYQLGVHITNVGGAVRKGSEVDHAAQERATAVYGSKLHKTYLPMLPRRVRDALSLSEGKETPVISYTCKVQIVDMDVRIVPETIRIHESCVISRARLTYEEAQHLLNETADALHAEVVYNGGLQRNNTFGLKERLTVLLQISESFFKHRVQSNDMEYTIEDIDELSSPQSHFLVSELMIWANRISAEYTLSRFPELALLRRQKPPNQEELESAFEKCKDIVAYSPVHKTLADSLNITTDPGSVVFTETVWKQLYDAIQTGSLVKAKNLLRTTNYHPQLAVLCKEVNSTKCRAEYVCSSKLQEMERFTLDSDRYLVPLSWDVNGFPLSRNVSKVYGHNDLWCLYTHATSPLRRYIDILVQRLILQSLRTNSNFDYSENNVLQQLSERCDIKVLNGAKFEKEYNSLSIALSLAKCSQFCTVHIINAERSLIFVIQELDYHCLSMDQRKFRLSSITSNAKPQAANIASLQENEEPKGAKEFVWNIKFTSFACNKLIPVKLENVKKLLPKLEAKPDSSSSLIQDAYLTFYLPATLTEQTESASTLDSGKDDHSLGLTPHCYAADFLGNTAVIGEKDWKKVTGFMKLPSPDTANQLKILLGSYQRDNVNVGNDVFPPNASFLMYEEKRSFKLYESFKASFTANYNDSILSPCIQLLEVAPMLNVCVQHSTKPADCFSNPVLSPASKVKYNDIHEYIELWESVLLAESAAQSVGEAEIQLIQDVPLKWLGLYPSTSLEDIYYTPYPNDCSTKQEPLLIRTTTGFEERCHDYFELGVGNLVCARYNIPLGGEKEVDGRKVTTVSAVYHLVISRIVEEDPLDKAKPSKGNERSSKYSESVHIRKIYLKFASKNTARVSSFIKPYLEDNTCEIQVIPLDIPYRRMYRSLLALHKTSNMLCRKIAIGNVNGTVADIQGNIQIKQDPLVYELWSVRQPKLLNDEQRTSVELAMRNKFQLIQGPPGTGKSVTGAHLAYASVISSSQSEPDEKIRCVMYCGPSNKSVDVVLDMFLKHPNIKDLRILRVYSKSIETKSYYGPHSNKALSKPKSEQECRKAHEPYALHMKIRSEDCSLSKDILTMEETFERYSKENKLPSPRERIKFNRIIKEAESKVIQEGNYQIVFCTCSEASSVRVVDNIKPTHLIIDEAAMATEPEAMIPIQLADHVTLIGDHQQLQPVINYLPAKENGLGCSLFERYAGVLEAMNSPLFYKLTTQYRMYDEICEFPSKEFYEGEVKTDPSVKEKFFPIDNFWPSGPHCPIVFCDVEGKEEEGNSNHKVHQESKSNKIEAVKIVEIILALKKAIAQSVQKKQQKDKDLKIAVLTPYKAQKYLVQDLLKKQKDLVKGLEQKTVTVGTINESQGSEFDFVIFSTVRSMPHRSIKNKAAIQPDRAWITDHLGFITDRHQILVAITRAKHGLVIVGNGMLLKYDGTWDRLLKHYEEKKCFVKPSKFPLSASS